MTCLAVLINPNKNNFIKEMRITADNYLLCEKKINKMNDKIKNDNYWKITVINI